MKIVKGFALLITAVALGLGSQIAQTPSHEEILARQLKEVDLDNVTLENALTRTLSAAHVPGGIVITTICGDQPNYVLTPSGPTLGDALNSIVTAAPQYRWYVQKGVVNLAPASGNPPLLDLRIAEFKVTDLRTVEQTVGQLLKIPKVREGIARLNLVPGGGHIGISALKRPGSELDEKSNGITLDCKNATVLEVLNAIALAHGGAVWEYREQNCDGRNEFSIGFLVS